MIIRKKLIISILVIGMLVSVAGVLATNNNSENSATANNKITTTDKSQQVERNDAVMTMKYTAEINETKNNLDPKRKHDYYTVTIYGNLKDKKTGKPIPHAPLEWHLSKKLAWGVVTDWVTYSGTVYTDNNGEYAITSRPMNDGCSQLHGESYMMQLLPYTTIYNFVGKQICFDDDGTVRYYSMTRPCIE